MSAAGEAKPSRGPKGAALRDCDESDSRAWGSLAQWGRGMSAAGLASAAGEAEG